MNIQSTQRQRFLQAEALPSPRIELRWSDVRDSDDRLSCAHNLVLDLKPGDIRREQLIEGAADFEDVPTLTIGIDETYKEVVEGKESADTEVDSGHGSILLPYRMTAHALWDARQLGLPVYVVSGERALRVDTPDSVDTESQGAVFVLQSDNDNGVTAQLFATRHDAEQGLRSILAEYTTHTAEGPTSKFTCEELEAQIRLSRTSTVNVGDSDAYWIQEQVVHGKAQRRIDFSKAEKEKRLPLVVAIQVFGHRKVSDEEAELVPVQEIRLNAQEKAWVRQWTWIATQQARGNATEVSDLVLLNLDAIGADAPLELGRALAKAGAAGFKSVRVNLCVIPDPVASTTERIRSLMAQDVFGDYDVPINIVDWTWIEENASFVHTRNAKDGILEFILNMALSLEGAPERLARVIEETRDAGISWLLIHQGT